MSSSGLVRPAGSSARDAHVTSKPPSPDDPSSTRPEPSRSDPCQTVVAVRVVAKAGPRFIGDTGRRCHRRSCDAAGPAWGQTRRRTVTTLPNTATSSASNSIGASRAFDGQQGDLAALAGERLDRGLVAGDAGHDDVAVVGRALGVAHDVVAVDDGGLDHRVAPHPQHEEVALAGEVGREGQGLLDVLLGQHVGAGGDVAHEGHVADRPALDGGAGGGVEAHLDGPGLGGVAHAGSRASAGWRGGRAPWTAT